MAVFPASSAAVSAAKPAPASPAAYAPVAIRQEDLIQSVADALQYISYYHPVDYIRNLAAAYEREESPAAKDAIAQILILDLVFSIDSIVTAVGMTPHVPVMVVAVVVAVGVMLLAAEPLSAFIQKNPTLVMLALAFLLMIGMTLIAEGFGAHVPKGYIYAAMAFSVLVEALNMLSRRAHQRRAAALAARTPKTP